jgi:hypothetical protein
MSGFLRVIFFMLFFSVGAAALSSSILVDDLVSFYKNNQLLREAETSEDKLKTLNEDYDALLSYMKEDCNYLERIALVTVGIEPNDKDTAYPKVTAEQLAAAKEALTKDKSLDAFEPALPDWLERCRDPRRRILLFFTGAVLILVSFSCFGPIKKVSVCESDLVKGQ